MRNTVLDFINNSENILETAFYIFRAVSSLTVVFVTKKLKNDPSER
jgi:hypothetical protein